MCHHTKFGCQKFNSSHDNYGMKYFLKELNPFHDLDLRGNIQVFLHDTLANDNAPPYKFCFQWFSSSDNIIITHVCDSHFQGTRTLTFKPWLWKKVIQPLCIDLRIDLTSDVSWCFTLFYLYTLTFVVLNCLLVLFIVEFEWPKRKIHFMHLLWIIKFFCICMLLQLNNVFT